MKTRPWVAPLLLAGAVLLTYLNAFRGDFQFDDFNVIVDNPAVRSWQAWLHDAPRGVRPVLKLTYTLNWTCGLGLFGFHLFNVAVHAANAVLVYFLFRRLSERCGGAGDGIAAAAPFLAALIFAVHPVQTEAVTYVSGRSMSLMTLFYLGSLMAYDYGTGRNQRLWLHGISPALFLLAMLTKEAAVTLPAALLLWEACARDGREPWGVLARRQAPHWILLLAIGSALAVHPSYRDLLTYGFGARSLHDNLLSQINGVAYLLSRLVMVHRLNIDPELPVLTAWTPLLAAEAILLLAMGAMGVASLRRFPRLGFGILWFFLHLLPTNSIVPRLDIANERHLYLAACGIFLAVGAGAEKLLPARFGEWKWVPAGILLGAITLGYVTHARNEVYRSEVDFWEDTVRLSPAKPRVHNNLGYAYQLAGLPDKAVRSYREALRIEPGFRLAKGNLATLSGTATDRIADPRILSIPISCFPPDHTP